jgi:hypothetical protein
MNPALQVQLETATQLLRTAGYTLSPDQPHLLGERFLMQNISTHSGAKLILLGTDPNGNKVVIKCTNDPDGAREINHERACRTLLGNLNFSYQPFHTPQEIAYWEDKGHTIAVQSYINQASNFIDRPLREQFTLALNAFKTQESCQATTDGHYRTIEKTFGIRDSNDYLRLAAGFLEKIQTQATAEVIKMTQTVYTALVAKRERIEQYCGFLTHTDFVPHNFRVTDDTMYLLDCASLEFGNKHESWARFLNFMTLYNYELETLLLTYVEENRSAEERESLQLMRLYRLIEIIAYYLGTLERSSDDLLELNQSRVAFWHEVLLAELDNRRVDRETVERYRITRDRLRSDDEKKRQQHLH